MLFKDLDDKIEVKIAAGVDTTLESEATKLAEVNDASASFLSESSFKQFSILNDYYPIDSNLSRARNEIPHYNVTARLADPSSLIIPTSSYSPQERCFILDPKYTKNYTVFEIKELYKNFIGIFSAKVIIPRSGNLQ